MQPKPGFPEVWQPMFNPMMMIKGFGKTGLRNFQNDRKVFVGGMPPNNTSKEINMKLKEIREVVGKRVAG